MSEIKDKCGVNFWMGIHTQWWQWSQKYFDFVNTFIQCVCILKQINRSGSKHSISVPKLHLQHVNDPYLCIDVPVWTNPWVVSCNIDTQSVACSYEPQTYEAPVEKIKCHNEKLRFFLPNQVVGKTEGVVFIPTVCRLCFLLGDLSTKEVMLWLKREDRNQSIWFRSAGEDKFDYQFKKTGM